MKIKFIQNKKADVPVMILVIGVVAICVLAIGSFIIVGSRTDFLRIELFKGIHADVEKFYFYKNLEFTNQEAVDMVNQGKDKLILDGNQLIINRDSGSISIKYIKNLG